MFSFLETAATKATYDRECYIFQLLGSDYSTQPSPQKRFQSFQLSIDRANITVVDTPGFDNESIPNLESFQEVESIVDNNQRTSHTNQPNAAPILFHAIYCHPVNLNQLGNTIAQSLETLVALCKLRGFRSFTILLVPPMSSHTKHQQNSGQHLVEHPRIQGIIEQGVEILQLEQDPYSIVRHIFKATGFHTQQGQTGWASILSSAKARLNPQLQSPDRKRAEQLEIEKLKSELRQSQESHAALLVSLALPASNLELRDLAKEFDGLNRDISRFVKLFSKHFKAGRDIGVNKLLVEPHQLEAVHKLLDRRGDRKSVPLYQSRTNRHMSVKLFIHNAVALIVCETLHRRVFRLFYPDLESSMSTQLVQMYMVVQDNNNETMSGKWRRETFLALHKTLENVQAIPNAVSGSIRDSISQVFQTLFTGSGNITMQQKTALTDLARPLAAVDALVQKAFQLNFKMKTEAILIGNLRTLYYPPGTSFDPVTMVVDGAEAVQRDDDMQGEPQVQDDQHTILSTFGLGLAVTQAGESGRELLVNQATVTDETSCDVIQ
ncbi:hypothetical protein BDV93DRAFT_545198 [Ceratobasidium sp. AG-I]|nr:hypothetical protein BDV93DRAFT_545198 [Ceratobasidium sp. AG-I]